MAISPMTPPGTKVVWIGPDNLNWRAVGHKCQRLAYGQTYHIRNIGHAIEGYFVAHLCEVSNPALRLNSWWPFGKKTVSGYNIKYFDYTALPRCLTSILERAPIEAEKVDG